MKTFRHFFDWSAPALACAADYLVRPEHWKDGLLDLSRHLIIVPSSHASRRLRERLALLAAERRSAVLPGRITTPSFLFQPKPNDPRPVADAVDAAILWQDVLSHLTANDAPTLLRGHPPGTDRRACAAIARQLIELRTLLCEEGHTFASFADAFSDNPEPERWRDLVRLEARYLDTLERENMRDETTAKLAAAENSGDLPDSFDAVHLLFCPDPPRLALRALEHLPDSLPVHLVILAPESEADRFDAWGRPAPEAWAEGIIPVADAQIHRFSTPHEQLRHIAEQIAPLAPEKRSTYAIGLPDGALAPPLRDELAARDIAAFDPAGCGAAQIALTEVALLLGRFFLDSTWDAFASLVRHPYLLDTFHRILPGFQTTPFLKTLDRFQNEHLPSDFETICLFAQGHELLEPVVGQVADWVRRLEEESPLEALLPILSEWFAERTFDNRRADEADFIAAARLLCGVLDSLRRRPHVQKLSSADLMQIILDSLEHQRIPSERPAHAVDLPGWLELHWEDAPRLLLCGMTDTAVPEVIDCHPFLPDQARRTLGLRHNADRFARDAYIFRVLLASRADNASSVQCCLAATGLTGDPTRPSRLLFLCEPEQLPARALLLFNDCASAPTTHHRVNDWHLSPPSPETLPPITNVSVSDFKSYLRCPFLHYLERRLRMDARDDTLQEMDAALYGTFCHDVLQDFAASPTADSDNEKEIADFLLTRTAERFRAAFGPRLSLPLMIQQESIQERLRFAAPIQAQARRDGWCLVSAEQSFSMPLRGVVLKGRIDRIEQRADGAVRLLDYKTSDKAPSPERAHLKKSNAHTPPWAEAPASRAWCDLQLPLYHHLYRHAHPETSSILCGYFNLSGVLETTALIEWPIEPELLSSALDTADTLAERMLAGRFWPPSGAKAYPPLADLFFDTPEETVDPSAFPVEVTP